eukprot:g16693.t1
MIRRRDEAAHVINTNPPHQHHSSTRGAPHGGKGSPSRGNRIDGTNNAATAAAVTKPFTAAWRRYLAASALALCAVSLLFQETIFNRERAGEGQDSRVPAIPLLEGGGPDEAAAQAAKADVEINLESLPYRLDDGGPGPQWVPPSERPIPLGAFPVFNGHGFKPNGNLNIVDFDVTNGTAPAALRLRNRSGGRGTVDAGGEEGGMGTGAGMGTTSTLLFMHIWKCAGSSLRHLLRDWASLKGQDIGIVVRCTDVVSQEKDTVCLQRHALINETVQAPYVRLKQVVAGHFTWGFQKHVQQPYVMFTTLRNPLELFVSGQQYLNRKASKHFAHAVSLVEETMTTAISNHILRGGVMMQEGMGNTKSVGFIYRLVDPGGTAPKTLDVAATEAMEHLDTFWLVGVIEQYKGFLAVLKHMMDPLKSERKLWQRYAVGKYNTSPQGAGKVLGAIDPALVQRFNDTLSHQWDVYSHAVELYKHRCKQMLHTRDLELCEVPVAPSHYTLTGLEREELELERAGMRHDGDVWTDLEREEHEMEREELLRQVRRDDIGGVLGGLERGNMQPQHEEVRQQDGNA